MSRRAVCRSASVGLACVNVPCESESCDEGDVTAVLPATAVSVAIEIKSAARTATETIKPSRRMRPPSKFVLASVTFYPRRDRKASVWKRTFQILYTSVTSTQDTQVAKGGAPLRAVGHQLLASFLADG